MGGVSRETPPIFRIKKDMIYGFSASAKCNGVPGY